MVAVRIQRGIVLIIRIQAIGEFPLVRHAIAVGVLQCNQFFDIQTSTRNRLGYQSRNRINRIQ